MIRVLVVDDSPSVRELLVYILGSDPEIEIVGCAADGDEALRMAHDKRPDVITMDLHMPNMNGFEATRKIMQSCPTPIVIVSGTSGSDQQSASFRAIEAGALVAVQRPFGPGNAAHHQTSSALIRTVKSMAEVKVVRRWPAADKAVHGSFIRQSLAAPPAQKLIAIGASTGGPLVLREILAELPSDYKVPIVIVQHMSPGFVSGFAEWLSEAAQFKVDVAQHGTALRGGCAYLAPDGFHMGVSKNFHVVLSRGEPEHGMCPAVAHLFRSIHEDICPSTIGVLLTGMGKDGAAELARLKRNGATTIAQDRATSAVYGMPGEALKQDAATVVLHPLEIGKTLRTFGEAGASAIAVHGDGKEKNE